VIKRVTCSLRALRSGANVIEASFRATGTRPSRQTHLAIETTIQEGELR